MKRKLIIQHKKIMDILKEISKTKYILQWGEKYSTLNVDMFARPVISYSDIISNDISEYVSYILNRQTVKALYSEEALKKIDDEHGRYFLKKERIGKLINDYDKAVEEYKKLIERFSKINFKKLSDQKLGGFFREYAEFSERNCALFRMTRSEGETGPSKKIKSVLRKYYGKNEVEENFRICSESTEADKIGEERAAWLEILKSGWSEKKIEKYIMDFAATFVNIYDISRAQKILKDKFQKEQKNIFDIEKEINGAVERRKLIRQKQKAIYAKCQNNQDLIDYSAMLQKFGPYRFKLKFCWAGLELNILDFFIELCGRMKVSMEDFFDLYLIDDVYKFFETGKALSRQEMSNRSKCILIRVKNKKYDILSGKDALAVVGLVEKSGQERHQELKGTITFSGYAKGRARVVHSTDLDKLSGINKIFKKGEILVSEGTQPAMVVLMKKAGAILAEVGGLTSHAAIVSREFRKPCIVGIRNLLSSVKDGDLVEVDAENGVVKILKRK